MLENIITWFIFSHRGNEGGKQNIKKTENGLGKGEWEIDHIYSFCEIKLSKIFLFLIRIQKAILY
jgi:hypothetical protein